MHPAAESYRALLNRVDRWFEAASARHPGVVPCRAGCTACCHGPFDISAADLLLLSEGVAALDPAARAGVLRRAEALLGEMQAREPRWARPWDVAALGEEAFDRLVDALADRPCPLLDDEGRCQAYEHRPMVCRLIGLPMLTTEGDVLENACPIQDQFPGYAALDPAPFDLEAVESEADAASEAAARTLFGDPRAARFETTIAAGLVHCAPPEG